MSAGEHAGVLDAELRRRASTVRTSKLVRSDERVQMLFLRFMTD
jgi:hypothetical protein